FFPPSTASGPPPSSEGGWLRGKYHLKTKRDKENTFSLLPSRLKPCHLPRLVEAVCNQNSPLHHSSLLLLT
ncbi:MAG: hypothetical protein ACI4HL_00335, partial [Ruminococcus sp.]